MAKSLVSDFLKAVVSKKDVRDVIDKDLIYPLGINSHLFDEGTQYPTAFLMFDYPNTLYSKILDEFRSLFMPEQYDATSYEIFMGLNDGKKKKEKYAKEDFLSFNRELYKSVDDKNDYSELYTKITGDVPKKSPVKLGEMIYTISQKIMPEDYDEIDNSRKIFTGIMTTALVAKCASLGSENLIKQANEIDKFLASALYATLPEETKKHSSEIFDEICELTRSALRKCGLPEENVKKYFSALNIYDQTHSSSTTPSEWNYSFTKDAANTFIAFNDNGRITNYFHDMRLIDMSIQEMLNKLKAHPSNDTYAYSLIQKVGASLTGKEYKTNQIKLEELNKVDAQTILLTTLNLLSTIEKGVDPSKKEDFDKLVATLVLPATEINTSMTNQEKEAILEKMKQLCTTDPEIGAIAGTSDIFKEESEESAMDAEITPLPEENEIQEMPVLEEKGLLKREPDPVVYPNQTVVNTTFPQKRNILLDPFSFKFNILISCLQKQKKTDGIKNNKVIKDQITLIISDLREYRKLLNKQPSKEDFLKEIQSNYSMIEPDRFGQRARYYAIEELVAYLYNKNRSLEMKADAMPMKKGQIKKLKKNGSDEEKANAEKDEKIYTKHTKAAQKVVDKAIKELFSPRQTEDEKQLKPEYMSI